MTTEEIAKREMLKEWDALIALVKNRLDVNGHDILIVPCKDSVRSPANK